MKKHMSVFSLAAAASFWRILMLLVALASTQLLAAWIMVKSRIGSLALEEILDLPVYRFSPAVGCPVCGEPMTERERICRRCRASLLERVNAFAGELLPAELDQFDAWMEDGGITTRSTWR